MFDKTIIPILLVVLLALPARFPEAKPGSGPEEQANWSVARQWNEELLDAIRIDYPAPTEHARNLLHTSAAMWDAWVAYEPRGVGYLVQEKHEASDIEAAREEAISYAAYRILWQRFFTSPGTTVSLASFDARMDYLGYDRSVVTTEGDSPAALGNRIAEAYLTYGYQDGSNEQNGYEDTTGYQPVNAPLIVKAAGTTLNDKNRWQPLQLDVIILQNGLPSPDGTQQFLGSHWGYVAPFALPGDGEFGVYNDPGLPPQLDGPGDETFRQEVVRVIRLSSWLDPDDGVLWDISPASRGNSTLGTNDGHGYAVNPHTGRPYEPQVVRRGDYGRILAEFWADGPSSETPPGHWNSIANYVSDHPATVKRIGGVGPVVSDLEWDVKLYLALNGAVHDAAVSAWGVKAFYDSIRPISAIRYMGGKGQSSDPSLPSYDPDGLPLIPGLIELITNETTEIGARHEHLFGYEGEIALYVWPGEPFDTEHDYSGIQWIRSKTWVPYQRKTFVTPPFAAYVSGHSTFSRAGAEVLTMFTGDRFFPGGMSVFVAEKNEFLEFEAGPSERIVLEWATYYDAADEAGISRLWGGIHVDSDDLNGRVMGSSAGIDAFHLAQQYFNGFPQTGLKLESFGADAGWKVDQNPRMLADVNGDGIDDLVGFADEGVDVAFSVAGALAKPVLTLADLGTDQGWNCERHLRKLADLDGDGRVDIVGFGEAGVMVAMSNGTGYSPCALRVRDFGAAQSWLPDLHPRELADVNGDGLLDIVGFGQKNVVVAVGAAGGRFALPEVWCRNFCAAQGWTPDLHLRMLTDVDADGRADIVAFGNRGVLVARSDGSQFDDPTLAIDGFGLREGWFTDRHPRFLADVSGDGLPDVVGFGNRAVQVALAIGGGAFAEPTAWIAEYGERNGWRTDMHLRLMGDVDGDGKADVIGFGDKGAFVSLAGGGAFAEATLLVGEFGCNQGWRIADHIRALGEVDGDCVLDIVGINDAGVVVY